MKFHHRIFLLAGSFVTIFASCHNNGNRNDKERDTSDKNQIDTTGQQMIPGTPGKSGTDPNPHDTTQAFRDSLKKVRDISDSSSGSGVK
jgi:hypothetical protein